MVLPAILPRSSEMELDQSLFADMLTAAAQEERLRKAKDLRTSAADTSQRMLNALQPGTLVPIHRHRQSCETVLCLKGCIEEILYEEQPAHGGVELKEVRRIRLTAAGDTVGCQVPQGVWHTVHVLQPAVLFEAKDGPYVPTDSQDIWSPR